MTDPNSVLSELKRKRGIKRIVAAFFYSIDGFKAAWRQEQAFRQEVILLILAAGVAYGLPVSGWEKLWLVGIWVPVLIVELINSALEAIVDRISLEVHPLSKNAKDFGSAAVMLTVALAVAVWMAIILPLVIH